MLIVRYHQVRTKNRSNSSRSSFAPSVYGFHLYALVGAAPACPVRFSFTHAKFHLQASSTPLAGKRHVSGHRVRVHRPLHTSCMQSSEAVSSASPSGNCLGALRGACPFIVTQLPGIESPLLYNSVRKFSANQHCSPICTVA